MTKTAQSRHPTDISDAAVAARIADIRRVRKIEATANWWSADFPVIRLLAVGVRFARFTTAAKGPLGRRSGIYLECEI